MTQLTTWTHTCPFRNEQSSLQQVPGAGSPGPTGFAGRSRSAENVCTLASLGISLPAQRSAHRAKGQEIKRLPRASEARPAWLRPPSSETQPSGFLTSVLLCAFLALC